MLFETKPKKLTNCEQRLNSEKNIPSFSVIGRLGNNRKTTRKTWFKIRRQVSEPLERLSNWKRLLRIWTTSTELNHTKYIAQRWICTIKATMEYTTWHLVGSPKPKSLNNDKWNKYFKYRGIKLICKVISIKIQDTEIKQDCF